MFQAENLDFWLDGDDQVRKSVKQIKDMDFRLSHFFLVYRTLFLLAINFKAHSSNDKGCHFDCCREPIFFLKLKRIFFWKKLVRLSYVSLSHALFSVIVRCKFFSYRGCKKELL